MKNYMFLLCPTVLCFFSSLCEAVPSDEFKGTSFAKYAESLRETILHADVSKLRYLVGNPEILDNHSIGLLIGSENNDGGLRKFFKKNSDSTIFVDSIHHDHTDVAVIYFVRSNAVIHKMAPGTNFISKLEFGTDFVACEVSIVDRRIFMPNTLCFLETDTFERAAEID